MANGKEELEALLGPVDDEEPEVSTPGTAEDFGFADPASSANKAEATAPESADSDDLDADISKALGWQPPTWFVPAIGGVAAVAVIISLWMWGGSLFNGNNGQADSLAIVDEISDEIDNELTSSEDVKIPPDSIDNTIAESATIGSTAKSPLTQDPALLAAKEALKAEDKIVDPFDHPDEYIESAPQEWLTEEEFYYMLNASVSERESARLTDDSLFHELLFAPLEGYEPPADIVQEPANIVARIVPGHNGTALGFVDTTGLTVKIDSLETQLAFMRNNLTSNQDSLTRLSSLLRRLTTEKDSLKESEIRRLAKIVDTMQPAYAANMLTNRSSDEVTEVLFKLKPRTAARVIEEFPVEKRQQLAYRVLKQ